MVRLVELKGRGQTLVSIEVLRGLPQVPDLTVETRGPRSMLILTGQTCCRPELIIVAVQKLLIPVAELLQGLWE